MKKGIHTIRGIFDQGDNPSASRKYSLDNGQFDTNMRVSMLELIPAFNDHTGSAMNDPSSDTMFFVVSTSEQGAIPTTTTPGMHGTDYGLRMTDNSQIGWGYISAGYGYHKCFVDPGHIIPGDLYVNAWSISSAGGLTQLSQDLGFMIVLEQVKNTGTEALLYQVKETYTGG